MKKLFIVPLICILALTFCFTGAAYARGDEELQLPNPGITPDSPFYFADIWGERIGLFFAFGEDAKVEKALRYAEERLAEVDAMMVRNNVGAMIQAAGEYDVCLAIATRHMEQAIAKGIDDTSETVALAMSKHIRFFSNAADNIPENAREVMTQTGGTARHCQETALRALAKEDPERAIRMNLGLMLQHLNGIRVMAEEPEPLRLQERLQERIREFGRLANLGQEISQIAKGLGLGQDSTTVDLLVGQATAYHLALLAEVHGQVQGQAQAQGAIEDAMQVCVKNYKTVVTALKEKDMLGQLPEKPPIPEGIPENVKQKMSAGGSVQKP